MKRIIDGKTYNTETATLIARLGENPAVPEEHDALYQTRFGAFFRVYGGADALHDFWSQISPLTPPEAQKWLEVNQFVDELEKLFGEQPEAGESESRVTLRIPDSLKQRIEAAAAANKQSLNTWVMRCLERCASAQASGR